MNYKIISRPDEKDYASYFGNYINQVDTNHVIQSLQDQFDEAIKLYTGVNEDQIHFRYAPEKWNIKEILLHILDTERIFTYRALRIARKDQSPLHGFEQDDYINNTDWQHYPFESVLKEYELVRKHTIVFFNNMTDEMLEQKGISDNKGLSVKAIPFIIAGHEKHHLNIIKTKYF